MLTIINAAGRRIANRESARRVRQKREDQLSDAQKQVSGVRQLL